MKTRTILVVDDSLITVRKLSRMLEELGYRVAGSAQEANEAVRLYGELRPDMVTMDITLPGASGIEAVKRIIEMDSGALIVMATSHGQEQMVIDSIDAGAKGYVMKPVNSAILKDTIEKVFAKYGDGGDA